MSNLVPRCKLDVHPGRELVPRFWPWIQPVLVAMGARPLPPGPLYVLGCGPGAVLLAFIDCCYVGSHFLCASCV